ncbi:hypothetical protein KJS94_04355 [Flavihumibacter rivuli]|uniref:hypothetical protein n=1 Tax=Flavihumibacter rivuli TaxID=2838156 RepID=UPI001BDE5D80|nr:hypothetical protein [Flavihumibacter rivuli]ULQ57432.1 hypothetical protein KJS94_04355 [Flavihumibacter rivuli]
MPTWKLTILPCLLLAFTTTMAQPFGGHPASVKWKQVQTPSARIVYQDGWDSTAQRLAGLTEALQPTTSATIGAKIRPITILLQPATTVSNGYVALAPWRSEWYMTPPSNAFTLGSLSWGDQLALHEFRHVQQYSNFNRGGSKVFGILLGEQGQAFANALTIPDWFFEGDAVWQETAESWQGRGRLPGFFNGYRSLWEADRNYSFHKLRNGSLKDYVPDHYQLGFQLVAYGRDKYGPGFWKEITAEAAAMKGLFYPFQRSLKKHTGSSYRDFVEKALQDSREKLAGTEAKTESGRQDVVDQESPVYTEKGDLLYIKSTYKQIPRFILKQGDGGEKSIRICDLMLEPYFNYSNGKILYASYRPDERWGWRDYSELQVLDVNSGEQETITRKTKYFSPAFSTTGDSIVTVDINEKGQYALHILDHKGGLLKVIPNPDNLYFMHPLFDGNRIVAVARNPMGYMSLVEWNGDAGKFELLLPWAQHVIGFPVAQGDSIYFSASWKGSDRLMLLDRKTGNIQFRKIGKGGSKTGTYRATINNGQLTISHFTAFGYRLETFSIEKESWLQANGFHQLADKAYGYKELDSSVALSIPPTSGYMPKPYKSTSNFFNFHSWQPYYEEPEFSISLLGQNLMNNFRSALSYTYNRNEGSSTIGYEALFGGWIPWIKAGAQYSFNRKSIYQQKTIHWNEMELNGGVAIPLNFSKGRSLTYLDLGSSVVLNKPYFSEPEKESLGDRSYVYLDNSIRFSHSLQKARQNIFPRFAQTVNLNYRNAIKNYSSRQFLANGSFYFPGLFTNHSFVVNLAFQQRDSASGIRFSNDFPFSRGYDAENLWRMSRIGVNYHLPIAYPDWGFGNILYLLRLRANLYYDHSLALDPQLLKTSEAMVFRSTGLELYFDTKWWNQLPVSFGVRYARLLDEDLFGMAGSNRWQIVLPINLIPNR